MNRSADWLHQARADLADRLRILDALYIPTRYFVCKARTL
ncbi:hypothetical protein IFHNHDMJ_02109 [Synechococcus sp. CBW1107]|nr:hypothetical protein IFHNHDMJ_02109 [Synechococcus sp. CBW1107]